MGYLTDNIPPGKNHAVCQELYPFRIIIVPGFASDVAISQIIMDEIPDVEEWQYSGRRQCPVPPTLGKGRKVRRVIHPSTYAQNSRRMRPFTEEVVYAFHTEAQRSQVAMRLDQERFKYRLVDEPTGSPGSGGMMVIIVP
jgi:hypothetical protein